MDGSLKILRNISYVTVPFRDVFRIQANIYDRGFGQEQLTVKKNCYLAYLV